MTKLAREIQLMELYEESQRFINDSIDELREDYSNINESYFFEADETGTAIVPEGPTDIVPFENNIKKKNLFIRFFQWVIGLFKKFGAFMKKLWERITGTRKAVKEANEKIERIIELLQSSGVTVDSTKSKKDTAWDILNKAAHQNKEIAKNYGITPEVLAAIFSKFDECLDDNELADRCGLKLQLDDISGNVATSEADKRAYYKAYIISSLDNDLSDDGSSTFIIRMLRVDNGKHAVGINILKQLISLFFSFKDNGGTAALKKQSDIAIWRAFTSLLGKITLARLNETITITYDKSVDFDFDSDEIIKKFKDLTDEEMDKLGDIFLDSYREKINEILTSTMAMYTILTKFIGRGVAVYANIATKLEELASKSETEEPEPEDI